MGDALMANLGAVADWDCSRRGHMWKCFYPRRIPAGQSRTIDFVVEGTSTGGRRRGTFIARLGRLSGDDQNPDNDEARSSYTLLEAQ